MKIVDRLDFVQWNKVRLHDFGHYQCFRAVEQASSA
ncbi:hypothetical protein J2S74_003899 [Evansella vedderi]|uniref:Uncharacterized protein n=1 Tax=Evansella vedderi TaxID=38282 RepID=A0ABU0A031_9BACI|nr:hypothetical protein [Evansella vedderi]